MVHSCLDLDQASGAVSERQMYGGVSSTVCQKDELSAWLIHSLIQNGSQNVIPDEMKECQASGELEKIIPSPCTQAHTHRQEAKEQVEKWSVDAFVQWARREASSTARSPESTYMFCRFHGTRFSCN